MSEQRGSSTSRLSDEALDDVRSSREETNKRLLLVYHRDGAELVPLSEGTGVVIGRMPPSNVTISDVSLSRQHARFTLVGSEVEVEDLGSTNGTVVGGKRIERARLRPGQEAILGTVTVTVHETRGASEALGLLGHDRFCAHVAEEVARSRYFGRSLSLLMVRTLRSREGHVRLWLPRVQNAVRAVDRLGLYSTDTLEVLLPEISASDAKELGTAIALGDAQGIPLVVGIASYPEAASSAEELIDMSRVAAHRAGAGAPVQIAASKSARNVSPASEGQSGDLVIESASMHELTATAARVARSAIPVLIQGETGAGKELVARFIHESSPRAAKPLVSVNCAAIPGQLVESTLFGHEKGAFTGAIAQHRGVFEAARGGTVFLDEVGELTPAVQAALLRVLEAKSIVRVGSSQDVPVDVRVLAATHRDLESMSEQGTFRHDLLYRLNAVTLVVPPLRERAEDIPTLAAALLEQANRANQTNVVGIDPEALELMQLYAWPGNVRELKNAIERAAVIAEGNVITVDDLPERVRAGRPSPDPEPANSAERAKATEMEGDFRSRMEAVEAQILVDALERAGWNQTRAARELEMPLRTLVHKIKAHGIRRPRE